MSVIKLDLRNIPVFERHPKIFNTWESLEAGDVLQIINDHDPKPLHYQFEGEYTDSYNWEYLNKGTMEWIVNITKTRKVEASASDLKRRVEEALDQVRPFLQRDGGDVELVDIDEIGKIVKVKLVGACGGCPSAGLTLKAGVEEAIKEHVPEIKNVTAV